jgi:putative thioredoxin
MASPDRISPWVFDATRENFDRLVLGNSRRGPVLVHFWTPKAGPCMLLMPRLVRLAVEYAGRFLLVMVNTDELGAIAHAHGVTSVPTVKLYRDGAARETVHGADPDATFRELLSRYVVTQAEAIRMNAHLRALAQWRAGEVDAARRGLAQAALEEPDNPAIARDLAKLMIASGDVQGAAALLANLPPELRAHAELDALTVHAGFIAALADAPDAASLHARLDANPNDPEARYLLAAHALAEDDMDAALAHLLELARSDRKYRDATYKNDIGRRGMIALFDLLGGAHPLARRYRPLLSEALRT